MAIRTSSETITFRYPFKLSGADDMQPAGRYIVETDEELLQTSALPAYRRLSTFIRLPGRSGSMEAARIVDIDPAELSAALAKDAQELETAPLPAHRPLAAAQGRKPRAVTAAIDAWRWWVGLNATELTWMALLVGGVALMALLT
jgi:hypothetical protein